MTRNKIIYIAIVALLGASLLLGFAEEVFRLNLGSASWAAHWATSPVALALGFAFAIIFGKTFPDFNKVMSKKLLQYSVIGLGFGMNVNAALASGSEGMMFTIVSVFGTLNGRTDASCFCAFMVMMSVTSSAATELRVTPVQLTATFVQ